MDWRRPLARGQTRPAPFGEILDNHQVSWIDFDVVELHVKVAILSDRGFLDRRRQSRNQRFISRAARLSA